MANLTHLSERFRRAADVEAETPITAGPPIVKKWWVKRADNLSTVPAELGDIVREAFGIDLLCYRNGDTLTSALERQTYEFDTWSEAITAAREFYRNDSQEALTNGREDALKKAEAGLRILEAAWTPAPVPVRKAPLAGTGKNGDAVHCPS